MPGQTDTTNDIILSEGKPASIIVLSRHVLNFPLNTFLYTHTLLQFSTIIRQVSFGRARVFLLLGITNGSSAKNKRHQGTQP